MIVELGHLRGTRLYRELDRSPEAHRLEGIYILRFDASFSFVNADYIRDHILGHVDAHPDTHTVLLDATSINDLESFFVSIQDIFEGFVVNTSHTGLVDRHFSQHSGIFAACLTHMGDHVFTDIQGKLIKRLMSLPGCRDGFIQRFK